VAFLWAGYGVGMDESVTWLRACFDDEQRDADGKHDQYACDLRALQTFGDCSCGYPSRVRADLDAKRQIIELHSPEPSHYVNGRFIFDEPGTPQCEYCASLCHSRSGLSCDDPDAPYPCDTVRLLALPYADRPGYRDEWRP